MFSLAFLREVRPFCVFGFPRGRKLQNGNFWRSRKRRKPHLVKVSELVSPSAVPARQKCCTPPTLCSSSSMAWSPDSRSRFPTARSRTSRSPSSGTFFGTDALRVPQADRRGRKCSRRSPRGLAFRDHCGVRQLLGRPPSSFQGFGAGHPVLLREGVRLLIAVPWQLFQGFRERPKQPRGSSFSRAEELAVFPRRWVRQVRVHRI